MPSLATELARSLLLDSSKVLNLDFALGSLVKVHISDLLLDSEDVLRLDRGLCSSEPCNVDVLESSELLDFVVVFNSSEVIDLDLIIIIRMKIFTVIKKTLYKILY